MQTRLFLFFKLWVFLKMRTLSLLIMNRQWHSFNGRRKDKWNRVGNLSTGKRGSLMPVTKLLNY